MKMVGALVAAARVAKGLTQRELAEQVVMDIETLASIEQGRRVLMPDVAERMDRILGLPGLLAVAANKMPEVDSIPPWAEEYFEREAEAFSLSWYDTLIVPGLLQTEAYARAVFRCRVPYMGEEKIEFQTARRMKRQEILGRPVPPTLGFVVWEAALRDRIGGEEIYREQLRHLRACADRPTISLQVLPLGITAHAGLDGPFILLETPDLQRLAYSETQRGSILVRDPNEVSILSQKYAMLRSQALNVVQTKGLLDQLLGE
ncbi:MULTISPECIES: helix-turn-helix transcriptional regulator [unclassified Streptomyces]|uniref:helix-turn-helix domain-containing protein n=1 Tax=unclassified Streptomyces TaxID=2593676 RepID=UPI002257A78E|nr:MULTISPECIES: helix-turn-helix transcriptional regulator [unclassified Streptomyces]MCX4527372.1 helix-turn-helix transcriptional regulator [Streptomyces sp. NBC_01551]MCX4542048.1 helix-turn-helix transcriptional regulator [Streptomyces sp. NBC_01565]